jgi:hypothetical protein
MSRTPSSHRLSLPAILAAISLVLGGSIALAQPQPRPKSSGIQVPRSAGAAQPRVDATPEVQPQTPFPQTPTGLPPTNPSPVELADEPFRIESIGLEMRLPAGTQVQANHAGSRTSAQILPETNPTWFISIQTPQTANAAATIRESADQTIALIQGAYGVVDPNQKSVLQTEAVLLDRTANLNLPGGPCERFYLSVPTTPDPGRAAAASRTIRGYTIFKPAPAQFVVFELVTPESEFPKTRGIFETTVATATFTDPALLAASRSAAVKAGAHILESLTVHDYDALCDGKERWYRLYRAVPGGAAADAEELGYRGTTFWKGKRGELDPARPRAQWTRVDLDDGYLARYRIRLVDAGDLGAGGRAGAALGARTTFIDTVASYFMSPDREQEAWSIQSTRRDLAGKTLANWSEIGARNRNDLTILVTESAKPPRTIRPFLGETQQQRSEGYLCQVESFLLPQILIRKGVAAEFGFYAYRSATETVSLRRETLARAAAGGGAWSLSSEFRDSASPQVALYADDGSLIRADLGDGRFWKPVEPEELLRLWKAKGLPTGPLK